MTDSHVIIDRNSIENYIARLHEFARVIAEVKVCVIDDRDHGVVPLDFIIEKAIIGMRAFTRGGAKDNPLVVTFVDKLEELKDIDASQRVALSVEAENVVATIILPPYAEMIAMFEKLRPISNHNAGIWRLPNGDNIYQLKLRSNTFTSLTADETHLLGLVKVARIEQQMQQILRDQGLVDGTILDRTRHLMQLPEHNFGNTAAGRSAQIDYLNAVNDQLMAKIGEYFITIPPQPLDTMRVPKYAEDSAPGGYYMPPTLHGSTPALFYINQKNTRDNPRWTLTTLMYHEGAPRHHFQLSATQLMEGVPLVRKLGPFNV